ncbi:MAG: NADH-quinone oxidoreductase subunit NuoG [Desulfobacteraceae bacterium]|jgi:NADH-quinone oxidoreductase subunit G
MEIAKPHTEWVTLHIEGKPYKAGKDLNLLHACLNLGFDVPHFCWHPALGSVGACRLCAVKRFRDENDTRGEIIMSCMTPVSEGMRISIIDPEAMQFRAAVIEWLMINHPHDCPVCDEGGECHLQDMTVMTGHRNREYRFKKRTHRNQNLGPFINHEMNRCIQCYRCVRFYRNTAGGRDLNVFGAHDHVYFGRHADGMLQSEFSGNLVEICPTGTFTDKTQKAHNTRIWDLQTAPSVCVHCGLGCNTLPGERYGLLRRVRNRYNPEINGYFLCDRGRFGYEFVNSLRRLKKPLYRADRTSPQTDVDVQQALKHAAGFLGDKNRVIGIGSPRASLEANAALRSLVGQERFHAGVSGVDYHLMNLVRHILSNGPAISGTIQDVAMADAVLVLGEDVTITAPRLALALREMGYRKAALAAEKVQLPSWDDAGVREVAQEDRGHLFIATPQPTGIDDAAKSCFRGTPDEIAALGFAVQDALTVGSKEDQNQAAIPIQISEALKSAERPLVIAGISLGREAMIKAAANIAWALCESGKQARIVFCVPECNSMGLALLEAKDLESAFMAVEQGETDTVVILENDLYRRMPEKKVDAFFKNARHTLVLDHLQTPTSARADLVFPVSTFTEGSGTYVDNEGRAQRFHAVIAPDGSRRDAFRLLADLKNAVEMTLEAVLAGLAKEFSVFAQLAEPHPPLSSPAPGGKVPRQSSGYSGRTAMNANISLHEPKPPTDPDSLLAYSMEGYDGQPPADLITRYQAPGWNSVQAVLKYQTTAGGPLKSGTSGARLLSPNGNRQIAYFENHQTVGILSDDERILIPLHHLYGSEELSMASPAVAAQAPLPYLALGPDDPLAKQGSTVLMTAGDMTVSLQVKVIPGLCRTVAGIPVGIPGIPTGPLPHTCRLSREGDR